jgi:hypothetical protein
MQNIKKEISKLLMITVLSSFLLWFALLFLLPPRSSWLFCLVFVFVILIPMPMLIPSFLILRNKKLYSKIKKRIKEVDSLSSYVLYIARKFHFYSIIFFLFGLFLFAFAIPLGILSVIITKSLAASTAELLFVYSMIGIATSAMQFLHLNYVYAVINYPFLIPRRLKWLFRISDQEAYQGGIDEAKFYLSITCEYFKENRKEWITSFRGFLNRLTGTFSKEKSIIIFSQIGEIDSLLYKIEQLDPVPKSKTLQKNLENLYNAISGEKIMVKELISALSGFLDEPSFVCFRKVGIETNRHKILEKLGLTQIFKRSNIVPSLVGIVSIIGFTISLFPEIKQWLALYIPQAWPIIFYIVSFYVILRLGLVPIESIDVERTELLGKRSKSENFIITPLKMIFRKNSGKKHYS